MISIDRTDIRLLTGMQLGGFAFIGEGIPVGLGAAYAIKYRHVSVSHPFAMWHLLNVLPI